MKIIASSAFLTGATGVFFLQAQAAELGSKVLLNKAAMSKYGVGLGEVTLSFIKR